MIKKTYVVGSDENEAWMRFRAKLTHADPAEASEMADWYSSADGCDPKCTYQVYEVSSVVNQVVGWDG